MQLIGGCGNVSPQRVMVQGPRNNSGIRLKNVLAEQFVNQLFDEGLDRESSVVDGFKAMKLPMLQPGSLLKCFQTAGL